MANSEQFKKERPNSESGYSSEEEKSSLRLGKWIREFNPSQTKIRHFVPRGLVNRGTYCYVNAVLQAFIAYPPIYFIFEELKQLLDPDTSKWMPVTAAMCQFISNFEVISGSSKGKKKKKTEAVAPLKIGTAFEPVCIHSAFKAGPFRVIEGLQQDAEEFLSALLNNLTDEMAKQAPLLDDERKSPLNTPIEEIFAGVMQRGASLERFFTLPVNLKNSETVETSLGKSLNCNVSADGENGVEVQRRGQSLFQKLPKVLILHNKCFFFDKREGCVRKQFRRGEISPRLRIDEGLLPPSSKPKNYRLYAIISHRGDEATRGHYVADTYYTKNKVWLHSDDVAVRTVAEEVVIHPEGDKTPYLLFYKSE